MKGRFSFMDIELFDYDLPEELIAQTPLKKRDTSRLMVLDKETGDVEHKHFYDILDYLKPGDVLVRNNTKVIPARLYGLKDLHDDLWECLVGNAKIVKLGTVITFGDGRLKAQCTEIREEGIRIFKMIYDGIFYEILDQLGIMPLPPYIKEKLNDPDRYQTVYAKVEGSAAAPTAGLHFTEELLQKVREKGVEILDVTLHVGLGTFRPVKVDDVTTHKMHSEHYEVPEETAKLIEETKKNGKRVIAVGTTSCRTLESVAKEYGKVVPCEGWTDIFIYPGFEFKVLDGLITNFHLPESTLIMLVSAFAGYDEVMGIYKEAVKEKYRFFSFGDSMFIE